MSSAGSCRLRGNGGASWALISLAAALLFFPSRAEPAQAPENLARKAKATATSEFGGGYLARFAWGEIGIRIENPHLNAFLLAPLAKAAGGTEPRVGAVREPPLLARGPRSPGGPEDLRADPPAHAGAPPDGHARRRARPLLPRRPIRPVIATAD